MSDSSCSIVLICAKNGYLIYMVLIQGENMDRNLARLSDRAESQVRSPDRLVESFCHVQHIHKRHYAHSRPSIIPFTFIHCIYSRVGRYCCRGMMSGLRFDRAKASAASWDIVSVRIMLPMDMKNLPLLADVRNTQRNSITQRLPQIPSCIVPTFVQLHLALHRTS